MNLGREDECTEFKKSTSELKEGVVSIAAILNKHGKGTLYFGVKNDGEVCGQDVSEVTLRDISQAIGNSIEPSVYPAVIHEVTPDGKSYVKVEFEGGSVPYSCNGRYRIRVADEDVLMSPEELRARFREAENRISPWDGRVSGKTVADVDEGALRKFVERGRKKGRIPFEYTDAADVLSRLGLTEGANLLNAGAVLFCPSRDVNLKTGLLASHARTDILDLKQEDGLVFDLVDKAEWFIVSNTRNRVDTFTPGPSLVYPEIPREALREGLMNAYTHRDWQTIEAVVVDIYNDAVEITSPGWFIDGQDPDKHLSGEDQSSRTRNPLIARTLYRSGDIEAYGTGIKRIKDLCDVAGIGVEYVRVPSGTKLVFHRNEPFGRSFTIGEHLESASDTVSSDRVNDRVNDRVKPTERHRSMLALMLDNPSITASAMAEALQTSESTIRRELRTLQAKKLIRREGSDKAGEWVVLEGAER